MQVFNHQSGKYLAVDDAKIYYEEIGDPSLPVVLMLHGGLGNMGHFNGLLARLPECFRVIGIDNRGHGKSTLGSQDLSYALLSADVEKVLAALGVERLSILGFSNGGTIAYRLAAFSKLKIERLITIGAPWNSKHLEPLMPYFSKLTVDDWIKQSPVEYQQYLELNPEPNIQDTFTKAHRLAQDLTGTDRPNEAVQQITCPLLIARGEHDPIVSESSIAELAGLVKGSQTLTLSAAGHEALLVQPDIFKEAFLKFMS